MTVLISTAAVIAAVVATVVIDDYSLQQEKMRWHAMHPGEWAFWQASCLESLLTDNGRTLQGSKGLLKLLGHCDAEVAGQWSQSRQACKRVFLFKDLEFDCDTTSRNR
jgi:hypothetical protein